MRYEFERGGRRVASVLWEGPAQVTIDVTDPADRPQFDRFFGSEVTYLSAGFDFGGAGDEMTSHRRDWTPWEFERSCRNLAHRLGCTARGSSMADLSFVQELGQETGQVEARPGEVPAR